MSFETKVKKVQEHFNKKLTRKERIQNRMRLIQEQNDESFLKEFALQDRAELVSLIDTELAKQALIEGARQ